MKKIFFVMLAAVLLAGCHSRQNEAIMKRSSSGKTLEVLLAADRGLYNGATKVLIDSIFRQAQEGLPQPEARFDVVNVPVSSLRNTQMFQMHRNIIICDVKEGNPDKLYIHQNIVLYYKPHYFNIHREIIVNKYMSHFFNYSPRRLRMRILEFFT